MIAVLYVQFKSKLVSEWDEVFQLVFECALRIPITCKYNWFCLKGLEFGKTYTSLDWH